MVGGQGGCLVLQLVLISSCFRWALGNGGGGCGGGGGGGVEDPVNRGRSLLGFKETLGNASFQCSPSGPCISCGYSEKNDKKYRCSETGFRVPLKCVEIQDGSKEETNNKKGRRLSSFQNRKVNSVQKQLLATIKNLKRRNLLEDSSTSEDGRQSYITYRSCVPVDGEEKLSVLGFEVIMAALLLVSGAVIYLRQKRINLMPGAVRVPTDSPRF